MDRCDLVAALREAQVPDAFYEIPGIHDVPIQPDAYYFLRPEATTWVVGLRERSHDSVLRRFGTEEEACGYLYDRLMRLPPSRPVSDEQIAEVVEHREEIQRDAWDAFNRARRERDT